MKFDYLRLMQEESQDLAAFLATLSDDEWNHPTLCTGWRVREVVSHMAAGHNASLGRYFTVLAREGLSVDRASDTLARDYAATHSNPAILDAFRRGTAGKPAGPTALVPAAELFTDHLVHHQDIRRPLGRPRVIPQERLTAALASLSQLSGRVGSKARLRGVRVTADDVTFSHGHFGAELCGPGEALIMALCGRGPAAADLRGEGAELLRNRLLGEAAARNRDYLQIFTKPAGSMAGDQS